MRKFENCVLLTRVGGFYELYFEHAEEFAPLLNLKSARRPTRPGAPIVPMVCLLPQSSDMMLILSTRQDSPSFNWIDISRFWYRISVDMLLLRKKSHLMRLVKSRLGG